MWYDNGNEGTFHGRLKLGQETTVNSYQGHKFYFTELDDDQTRVANITASVDQVLYIINANTPEDQELVPQDLVEDTRKQLEFMKDYYQRTGKGHTLKLICPLISSDTILGIHWRHYFANGKPRDPPVLYMWPASYIGETHKVISDAGYW